ncbi:MAG: hypothetical protein Q8N88_03160 [Nanoarchaeota archaeon]|nr:hypothetical protein [Nanoarchaeota archaeon]
MRIHRFGQDANGQPFEEKKFYVNKKTKKVIQLHRGAAGFRVQYGFTGEKEDIFNLNESQNYRPATPQELRNWVTDYQKRTAWLQTE